MGLSGGLAANGGATNPGGSGSSFSAPTEPGNLGATQTINFGSPTSPVWEDLIGTLSANLVVTATNYASAPGCRGMVIVQQPATFAGGGPYTLSLDDGSGAVTASISQQAGAISWVMFTLDGSNEWFQVLGNTGLVPANNLSDVLDTDTSRYNLKVPVLRECKAAATSNVASRSGTTTIDGVALAAGDRVLLTAQTTSSQNGPWVVQSGAWTRPNDYPTAGVLTSRLVGVGGGTGNSGVWQLKSTTSITIDTTATTWANVAGAGTDTDFYQTLKIGGSAKTQRGNLNLIGAGDVTISASDNAGADGSDVTITGTARQQALWTALGLLSETHRLAAVSNAGAPTSQAAIAGLLGLLSGDVVTNVIVYVATAGVGTTPTLIRLGIADKTGKILAVTADVHASAAWTTSNTAAVVALSSPLTIPSTDGYYACFLENGTWGTTAMTLGSAGGSGGQAGAIGSGVAAWGKQTAQADLPAVNSSLTLTGGGNFVPWFGAS